MLRNSNLGFSSPQPEQLLSSAHSPPAAQDPSRGSTNQSTAHDGLASPRQVDRPGSPSKRHHKHHSFSAPRPSLSPLSEYHSGYTHDDLGSPFSPSHTHRRQPSIPNLLPLSFRSRTPSPTRKPQALNATEDMPLTGDNRSRGLDSPKTGLSGWFGGATAAPSPDTTPVKRTTTNSGPGDPATPKNAASRFMSAISSRFTPAPTSPILDDEICNIDIEAALFPPGSPTDRDAFSPAAFKNLQMNARGLLIKMQTAYRDRVAALQELQAEKLAQREEVEETETRSRHLKMQLEGMARKAQEQEQEMLKLRDELAAERKARLDDRNLAEKVLSQGSIAWEEDLDVDEERRRKRRVRKSADTAKSEVSYDTDDESAESESVFSRCRSPTSSTSIGLDGNTLDNSATPVQSRNSSSMAVQRARAAQPQQSVQPITALQKFMKGLAGESDYAGAGAGGCRNCKGKDASVAWDTVSLLRDENKQLKGRVGELEMHVEATLDLVRGIGLG